MAETVSFLRPFIQYQKPQVYLLGTLSLPLLSGIYNFGWRVLVVTLTSMLVCWATEYAFTRRERRPASSAALVTGALLALILPPNIPFWQVAVGGVFAMVFGKMVFGGFGRNVFNPALVGRCFLYISFPATVAASWYAPMTGSTAGFLAYTPPPESRTMEVDAATFKYDGLTSATVLSTSKKLQQLMQQAHSTQDHATVTQISTAMQGFPLTTMFFGNINGCVGETSTFLLLLCLIFLLYQRIVAFPLFFSPLLGLLGSKIFLRLIGVEFGDFTTDAAIAVLGGGTMFACVFMTTEPITAPTDALSRWLYGLLIGFLAGIIRSMSAFNEGLMFAVLLGNTFGPLLEIVCTSWKTVPTKKEAGT